MNSHRQGNKNLARSSYSGSFKIMHLGPLKSRRRAVYIVLYILYILSIVSVHIASSKRWQESCNVAKMTARCGLYIGYSP